MRVCASAMTRMASARRRHGIPAALPRRQWRRGNVGGFLAHLLLDDALESKRCGTNGRVRRCGSRGHRVARRDAPQAFRTQQRAVTRPITPPPPNVAVTCSARRPRSAGPAAGTRCRHGPTRRRSRSRRNLSAGCAATGTLPHGGYDLEVDAPRFVPLDIMLQRLREPGYFRSHVLAAVRAALSACDSRWPAWRLPSRQLYLRAGRIASRVITRRRPWRAWNRCGSTASSA